MYSSQHIIDVKKSGLTDTATYRCIVLSNGSTGKLNNAALESVGDNAERMIAGKEEGNSSGESRADKGVNITSLVVSSRTTTQIQSALISSSCAQDLCPSACGSSSGGPENVSHHFGAVEQTCRPVFLEKPKSLTIGEGECVRFTCRLKGQPIPVVRWEKDGRQIIGDRVQITSDGEVFSLSIPCSAISDAGRYVCVATNDAGEARSMVSLIVQKGSGPTAKFPPTDVKPSVNTRSQIRTFNLRPMDQYSKSQSLQKNLVEVQTMPSETVKISCRVGVSSLDRASVSSDNDGTYVCQKENDRGMLSAKCQLMIQKQPTAVEMVSDHLVTNSSEDSALQQHGENTVIASDIGARTELSDSSKGDPLQSYDVLNLPAEVASNGARHSRLHSANSNDSSHAASLKRRLSSKVVSSSTPSSQSTVLYSPNLDSYSKETESKPRSSAGKASDYGVSGDDADDDAFERPLDETNLRRNDEPPLIEDLQPENVSVVCGSEFQLIAKFWGQPAPQVKWYKGSEPLTQNEDNRIRFETNPQCSILTVRNAKPQDTGIYALALSNKFGQDRQFSSVTIEDKPEPPVGPPAVTSILDNSLVLSWSGSSYDGGCPVLKYKVEVSHDKMDTWECLTDDCQHTTYHVLKLDPNTEYVFRVSAANKHGFSIPGELSHPVVTNGVKKSASTEDFPFLPRVVAIEKDRKFADFYALGEEIGKGKFGSVYKCSDKLTGRLFAAKFIHKKSSGQSSEYLQEMEVMNELHHPKLLLLWDAFESRREIVLITEHVSGGELMERIINDDYVLTERECIHFMRQICEGAMYMHSCNILHLDLKPENILCVTPNSNEIKIIDFGLARKFDPDKEFRIMFGTAEFVAPEVINYDTIGYTTDMWSVGVICYVLLSGLSPFLGDNDKETFVNVTKAHFDFDDDSFDDITADAKDFIDKLLVKDPKKRLLSEESLRHQWLAQDVTYMRAKKISTHKHKKFMARSKWQKTGHALMALRRMVELQRASFSHGESCRSTSSLSSHADAQSVVSDQNERMSESDDSGFNSCQAQSGDSKDVPVSSKDLEALANAETTEPRKSLDRAVSGGSSLQMKSEAGATSREASLTESGLVSDFSPDVKTRADAFGDVSKSSAAEIVCERMDFVRKEEKEMTEGNLVPTAIAKDSVGAKTEGKCMQFEEICIENMERKKITLPMRKEAVQTVSSCTNEPEISCKQLPEPPASQPPDQIKRKLFARKSCDVQAAPFSRSFDQTKSVRVSEKLKQARNVFDNPGTPAATFQRNSLYYASQGRGSSVRPREFKVGAKAGSPVGDTKKPHATTLNSKSVESSSVAARKLAVQQFSAQRSTKPKKAPTFVRRMKNLDVVEGDAAKFEIVVDGNPSPTVSWLKDGKEIPVLPQKYKTELHDGGKYSLTIVNCGEDDDAEYGCKASNSLGNITNKANLYVEPVGEVLDCSNIPQNLQK